MVSMNGVLFISLLLFMIGDQEPGFLRPADE